MINSDDEESQQLGLLNLSETLAYGNADLLEDFPCMDMAQAMVQCLGSNNQEIQANASLCIFQFLEAHPASTRSLVDSGAMPAMKKALLSKNISTTTSENLLRAANIVADFRPRDLSTIGLQPIIRYYDFSNANIQRLIAHILSMMTRQVFSDNFIKPFPDVAQLMLKSNTPSTLDLLVQTVYSIGIQINVDQFPLKSVKPILTTLQTLESPNNIEMLIKVISRASENEKVGERIITLNFDFSLFLFPSNPMVVTSDIKTHLLKIIVNLLPIPDMPPNDLYNPNRKVPNSSSEFSTTIQPLLIKLFIEKGENDPLAIIALAMTFKLTPVEPPDLLYHSLCNLIQFFTLVSNEFANVSLNLWRNDFTNKEKYAMTTNGLFPKIGADPNMFYLFGKLCAKASAMGHIIPFPFNKCFFKLVKKEKISIEEVDVQLSNSLKNSEGLLGLTFVYPGTEIELIKNGAEVEVDKSNVKKFVELIEDFTCGSKVQIYGDEFARGFCSIYRKGVLEILTADELCSMIAGDDTKITMKDLMENVEVSHGYIQNSPQIKMLFEIIVEMEKEERAAFVKFVTGCERLPIGGLARLSPKLTIAKKLPEGNNKAEDLLPSVMTCTNYFKLPAYKTKEQMKEKILLAIKEGQGAFLLT
ncbi:ubiquitin-protein ligase E3 [Histomonas meleagridis]|uniref:ubiquitin-protein ligase E3 n=1 Tax=Histomonas meleagridis TaxID=135588 RepID=UPI00355A3506|nr:ubiquitin-protein ligase E3 [Histomonas meleagridis]KAH0803626.1 ubiquitin-protein ligase E3 [Histomonas meleagridis]